MSDFEDVSWALEQVGISDDNRRLILTSTWTLDQIPKIETEKQAEDYRSIAHDLNQAWRSRGKDAFVEFVRSRNGMLATAYGARVIEWEDKQRDGN